MQEGRPNSKKGYRNRLPYYPRDARKAKRVCPASKTYPDNKVGHWLVMLGVLMLFLFAPMWIWVIGLGVALILVGMHFISKE
ncbi:MAG: hypothetical protein LBS72_08620 [Oscillospiraceae bacterium]|jgi:hypothetical protein|nr:hypothetical protein [Oscillospiraceae bacterium]